MNVDSKDGRTEQLTGALTSDQIAERAEHAEHAKREQPTTRPEHGHPNRLDRRRQAARDRKKKK